MRHNISHNKGFTLLEMIVALGIFSIVAVIAVGSLVKISSLNRASQSMQAALNNSNYILESISREMRFAKEYHCIDGNSYNGSDSLGYRECNDSGDKGILFKMPKMDPTKTCFLIYGYWFVTENQKLKVKKSQQTSCGENLSAGSATDMVDIGNVTLNSINFKVSKPAGGEYAFATVELIGYSGSKDNEKSDFDIRTSVSQRIKD